MVKLLADYVNNPKQFEDVGITVPKFDQEKASQAGRQQPVWVHFGGGNLFRCFHAAIAQRLLNTGALKAGVIVAETYDAAVINQMYQPYHNRFLRVVMTNEQPYDRELVASVADSLALTPTDKESWNRLKAAFTQASLQLVTFSITEKGYGLTDLAGQLIPAAKADISQGPGHPQTNMGILAALLYARYQNGQAPLALVSTDNFSQNGQKLEDGMLTIAQGWLQQQLVPQEFVAYLQDRTKITFPWSMIDRITPNPAESVAQYLAAHDFEDTQILHTAKRTNIAPFGNTEAAHYLVLEDDFPNGRPDLTQAGVILTDRATVNLADQMKVTACLNPLHTALAIFGCLLGYQSIAAEVADQDLLALIKHLGYQEDLPAVVSPKIIDPKQFIDELITKRLPNPNIPDTPQRIATDTSQKMAVRYGVTLTHYAKADPDELAKLTAIPLIIAGWCRYLMGLDDHGETVTLSPDPLLADLQPLLAPIQLGTTDVDVVHNSLQPILSNPAFFGHDLYALGLGETIEKNFMAMISGPGAVRETLHAAIAL
ncbi:mannitol dehydrogenase family protein [Lactiplantibacillus daoliensis]|uniref:Mannitol dehydrogenase family protein n=1 Tax=Lactiplantibacillus daoliensis TaxID=2559916 RepID=A0ABW1UGE8_9LACO|nr:mannitol dehydrogenase family protein [Lactiplantibacillus daoliensis]